jgi:hypothetical protein
MRPIATHDPNGSELRRILDRAGLSGVELEHGKLPALAGADTPPQAPVFADVLGGVQVEGTALTVDSYVNPPTQIPAIIRNLVAANEGYFAERIFATPGFTVEGGAIVYEETFPEDFFLPEDQSIAPRAPGAPAPTLGATRRAPKIARPESWSGAIEVTDEARKHNKVIAIRRQFTQAANTIADRIQTRAMEVLAKVVVEWGRQIKADHGWRVDLNNGVPNANPKELPGATFAKVFRQFIEDKAGMRPDILILHPADAEVLQVVYQDRLPDMLALWKIREMLVSPMAEEGAPYFVKSGGIGVMAFDKPLEQEQHRERGFKDVFELDVQPVLVAFDASAITQLTGVDKEA